MHHAVRRGVVEGRGHLAQQVQRARRGRQAPGQQIGEGPTGDVLEHEPVGAVADDRRPHGQHVGLVQRPGGEGGLGRRAGRRALSATGHGSSGPRARYTAPCAPRPISASMR